jgi:hypothetical protein
MEEVPNRKEVDAMARAARSGNGISATNLIFRLKTQFPDVSFQFSASSSQPEPIPQSHR